jgi:hypothetical protein
MVNSSTEPPLDQKQEQQGARLYPMFLNSDIAILMSVFINRAPGGIAQHAQLHARAKSVQVPIDHDVIDATAQFS